MTTVQPAAPGHTAAPAPAGGRGDAVAAIVSLARVEGWRLLCHPVVLVAVALVLAVWTVPALTGSGDSFPLLYLEDTKLMQEMMLVAAAAMIAANLAMLRTHRHGVTVFTEVLVLLPWRHTLAQVLAVLPLAALAGLLVVARMVQLAWQPFSAGRPDLLELAVAPVAVLLFGSAGVLLGRLVRSTIVAPLLLVLLVFFWLFQTGFSEKQARWSRLSPLHLDAGAGIPLPVQLIDHPAGTHLLYLLALAVLIAVAALWRAGAPAVRIGLTAVVVLLIVVACGAAQLRPTPDDVIARRTVMTNEPSRLHTCTDHDTVTYCAFGDFVAWTGAWRRVVDGVRHRVPADRGTARLAVRQRTIAANIDPSGVVHTGASVQAWQADDRRAGTPDAISVGTDWQGPVQEIGLAVHVAHRLVTGSGVSSRRTLACGGAGVVTTWLAGQSTPDTRTGLSEQLNRSSTTRSEYFESLGGGAQIEIGVREITVAQELLARPTDQVAAAVARSWQQLTVPGTTVEQAAALLGATAPAKLAPMPSEELAAYGDGYQECG